MWGKQSHREALRDRSDSSVTGERCEWCRKPTCAPSSLTRRVRTQSRTLLCCGVVKRVVSHNRVPRWMQLHPSVEPIGSKSSRLTGRRACSVGAKPEACRSVSYVRARLVQKRRAAFERTCLLKYYWRVCYPLGSQAFPFSLFNLSKDNLSPCSPCATLDSRYASW